MGALHSAPHTPRRTLSSDGDVSSENRTNEMKYGGESLVSPCIDCVSRVSCPALSSTPVGIKNSLARIWRDTTIGHTDEERPCGSLIPILGNEDWQSVPCTAVQQHHRDSVALK